MISLLNLKKPAAFALIAVALFVFADKLVVKTVMQRERSYIDFTSYYVAAYELRHGNSPYATLEIGENFIRNNVPSEDMLDMGINFPVPEKFAYTYPPLLALLLSPLTFLPYGTALYIWWAVNLLLLGGVILAVLSMLKETRFGLMLGMVLLLFLASMPSFETFSLGQVNYLVLLLCLLAFIFDRKGKILISAFMLAAASFIKITPAVLLLYFIFFSKGKRYFFWYLGFCAGFFAVCAFSAGTANFIHYLTFILPKLSGSYLLDNNKSLISLVSRVFKANPMVTPLALSNTAAAISTAVIALGLTIFAALRLKAASSLEGEENKLKAFSLALLLMLLIQTLLEIHHLIYAFLPLCVFVLYGKQKPALKGVLLALLLLMLNTRGWNAMEVFGRAWWVIFLTAPQVWGLALLFLLIYGLLKRQKEF